MYYKNENEKIPRKLKKKIKEYCGVHYDGLTNAQRLWHYMEKVIQNLKNI